ncbi:MAG TPA: hypothetical protein VN651_10025 [Gemmatimonadaceae bacterium]|nr:hypothetical protein [Gemmatimonadaceae bacterium]
MNLTVHIPGNILPVDRGKRFADPIDAALRNAELGELRDEGTQMGIEDGRVVVVGCDIVLRVTDPHRALEVIRRVLREAGAPAGTSIREDGGARHED